MSNVFPCPLCGGKSTAYYYDTGSNYMGFGKRCRVRCETCMCEGPVSESSSWEDPNLAKQAIEKWNMRNNG